MTIAATTQAMRDFRKALMAVEASRGTVAALVKAADRSGATVATQMASMIATQLDGLAAAMAQADEALAAVVAAGKPAAVSKPAKAA